MKDDLSLEIRVLLTAASDLLPSREGLDAFVLAVNEGELQSAYAELLDIARKHPLPLLFWTKVSRASELLGVP